MENTAVQSSNIFLFLRARSHFHATYYFARNLPHTQTHTHTQPFYDPLGFCLGLPGKAGTRKVKPGRIKQYGFTGARDSE